MRILTTLALMLACFAVAAQAQEAKVPLKPPFPSFAFGTPDSPAFPGFTKVTHLTKYDDAAGFGWLDVKGLESRDRTSPGTIERAFVKGGGTFAVKLANGKYHVWMLMNDSGGNMSFPRWTHRLIKAGGKVAYEKRMTHDDFLKSFYANLDVEDLPGQDVFMLYVESRWWPVEFDAEVSGGRLEIEISDNGDAPLVNAMIVYPLGRRPEGEKWLAAVREKRRAGFYANHKELEIPEKPVDAFPNEAEKDRGYVVFQRPTSDPVYPTSSPKGGGEEIDRIDVSIAHGQFLSIPICVYPFQDLGNVKVTGDVFLPYDRHRSVLHFGYVQYKLFRWDPDGKQYQVRPALIRNKDSVRIDKGVTRQFWLTLEMPEGFAAKTYGGEIVITPEHGGKLKIPLTVHVLDFALPETKDFAVYTVPKNGPADFWKHLGGSDDEVKRSVERSLDNIRNHSLTDTYQGQTDILPGRRFYNVAMVYKGYKEARGPVIYRVLGGWMDFWGDPFFDLDGELSENGLVYPSPEGDLNTPRFEVLREGITDFRYLWTLDKLTEEAKKRNAEVWRDLTLEGEAFLKDIREKSAADVKANKWWSDARLDAMRAKAAELISKHVAAGAKLP